MPSPIRLELPTIFGMKTVNAYLFKEPEPVLVDCGEKSVANWAALQRELKKNGMSISDISRVVLTHAHSDHMGIARKITQYSEAEIWLSDYMYDWAVDLKKMLDRRMEIIKRVFYDNLENPGVFNFHYFGYKNLESYWEEIPADRIRMFPPEGQIEFGGQQWQIIYTPGHCINQSCFYQPEERILLSADMLLKLIPTPIVDAGIEPPYHRAKGLPMLVASYQKLAKLDIDKVFPGHYEPFGQASGFIRKHLQRIEAKKNRCFDQIRKGTSDFMDLFKIIYPNRIYPDTFFMLVGLLDLLQEEGKVESDRIGGKLQYFEKKEN